MATLNVQSIVRGGLTATFASAASGGDKFLNDGNAFLEIVNAHASNQRTLTIQTPGSVDGLAIPDRTVTIAALGRAHVGPFPKNVYNDANNFVNLSYSDSAANLTIAILKLSSP